MAGKHLNQLLERLNLLSTNAVFFTSRKSRYSPVFTPEVQHKLELINPDAYYSFNNKPYILFFDLSDEANALREDEIHKQVWSFDSAPVIFIIKKGDIEVYNAFYYQKERNRLERLSADENEIVKQFSFWNVQSGSTWQWLQAEKYKDTINKKRVNQRLFDNIKAAREKLEETGLSPSDANITILRLIFIRYLIDRGVGIKKEFISGETIFERRKSLSDLILNASRLFDFFEYLNDRFNGALFKQKSSFRLKKEQGLFLSQIFDVRKDKTSPTLFDTYYFDVFDFSIIPVEVISGIYESVIDDETKDKDSAVYTPPFLVEYILEETVDKYLKKKRKTECKIFDPACGSGIFLVQSYRRMVDEEIRKNKNSNIESGRLRDIAENNLFGIDLNEQALLVASFSIYIAILDYKEPKEINTFKFPNLIGQNLFAANFFDAKHEYNKVFGDIDFDFILGNPPWKSKKDDKVHTQYIRDNRLTVGRYEIAQTFLLRSATFMSDTTQSALIVTSTIFYNISSTTKAFKNNFLSNFSLDVFFDLSAVRRLVFESAISPASIVIYRKATPQKALSNIVHHYSVKSNIFLKYFRSLVIEKFDRKEIQQKHFIEYDWMFKVALYGNTLDFNLLKRINDIEIIVDDLIDERQIFKGDGILTGSPKEEPFKFLINKPIIENREVARFYTSVTEHTRRLKRDDVYLESGRRIELFEGEHILLKAQTENESEIVISYCEETVVFRHDTLGITSKTQLAILKTIYSYFISKFFTYFQFLHTSAWGIATRPAIRLEEYLSFPFIRPGEDKTNKLVKLVDAILSPIKKYYQTDVRSESIQFPTNLAAELNAIVNGLYEISLMECDLIDYVMDVSRYQFQESKQATFLKKVHTNESFLRKYSEIFFLEMEEIYEGEYLQAEIYSLDYFIAINFKMLPEKPSSENRIKFIEDVTDEEKVVSILSGNLSIWSLTDSKNAASNIFIQKDIKGFENDSFYIIKPNEFKCWHRAMAWYDVAEIKEMIEKAEMETLIESK